MKDPNQSKATFDDLFAFKVGELVCDAATLAAWRVEHEANGPIKRLRDLQGEPK